MTDRPIIFSAPMVRALLDGRKTQTRRIIKNVPASPGNSVNANNTVRHAAPYLDAYCSDMKTPQNHRGMSANWCWWTRDDRQCLPTFKVPCAPGDHLWVREAHAISANIDTPVWFRLDHEEARAPGPRVDVKWRPSIHMPRWASRLTLIVEGVKVERLQDISEDDAEAEGCESEIWDMALACRDYSKENGWFQMWGENCGDTYVDYDKIWRASFRTLWDSLNAERAPWSSNPFVAAIRFRVIKANIDQVKEGM